MEVTVIRSNRKTMAIQVNPDLTVTVRAPMRASKKEIERILQEKESWIRNAMNQLREKSVYMNWKTLNRYLMLSFRSWQKRL